MVVHEQRAKGPLTERMLTLTALNNVFAFLLITLPLMVRRESMSLVVDAGLCAGLQGAMFGVVQVSQLLGSSLLIAPDLAAWLPVIIGGCLAAIVGGWLKT